MSRPAPEPLVESTGVLNVADPETSFTCSAQESKRALDPGRIEQGYRLLGPGCGSLIGKLLIECTERVRSARDKHWCAGTQ